MDHGWIGCRTDPDLTPRPCVCVRARACSVDCWPGTVRLGNRGDYYVMYRLDMMEPRSID